MKKLHLLALCLALVACSCGQKPEPEPIPDDPTPTEVKPGPGEYSFVLPANSVKKAWAAGDQIIVQGNYSPGAITVTLAASDIQADGRTAKVNLTTVPDTYFAPDYLYAGYPAELIDMDANMFCEDAFHFTQTDQPLMCAWLGENHTFNFMDVSATVTFSVDGDWDGCVVAGPEWEMIGYESFYEVSANSETQNWRKACSTMDYFMPGKIEDGKCTLFFPGGVSLSKGLLIYLKKDGEYPKVYEYTKALNLEHDGTLDLGNITSSLKAYSGAKPESPEMPVLKGYTKYTVSVTEISGLCLTADGSALWAVGDNGYLGQVSFDGQTTKFWTCDKNQEEDMEGVTIDPVTGDLYIALEYGHHSQSVARVSAPDYTKESFTILFKVDQAKGYYNSGLEGITYYKDDMVYVGSQTGANLFLYKLNGEQVGETKSLQKITRHAIKEVGGLCYDAEKDWLWVTDSETHKLYVLDGEITHILATYSVMYCSNNEAIIVDRAHGCVWVGNDDDTPRVYRLEFEGL